MKKYELDAEQWRHIEPLIPGKIGDRGRSGDDNLSFVNGVLWVLRSGPIGMTYLTDTGNGRWPTNVLHAGRMRVSGKRTF